MTGGPDVARLIAYEEIRQLAARYAVATDARDLDTLVSLFIEDVRVGRDLRGRDALKEFFTDSLRGVGVTILNVGTHQIKIGGYLAGSSNSGSLSRQPVDVVDMAGQLRLRETFSRGVRDYAVEDLEQSYYAQDHWISSILEAAELVTRRRDANR